jgi:hypothetical protein
MRIQHISEKIKRVFTPETYTVFIIIFVGVAGFGMGRLSVVSEQKQPIHIMDIIENRADGSVSSAVQATERFKEQVPLLAPGGKLVASKEGKKYHFPWCPGARRMAEENKIWFNSIEEARSAGYKPAANCKGLH